MRVVAIILTATLKSIFYTRPIPILYKTLSAFPDHEELPIIGKVSRMVLRLAGPSPEELISHRYLVSKQLHHNVCNVCFTEFRKKEKKKKKRKKWHAFIPRTDLTFVVHSGDQEIGETSRVSSSRCCSQPLGRRTLGTRDISGQFNPVSFLLFKFFYSILFRSGLFFSRLRAVTKLRRTNLIVVRVALFLAAQPFFFLSSFFFFVSNRRISYYSFQREIFS